jgi:hypothetical protein
MAMGNDYTVVRSVHNLLWNDGCSFTPLEGFDDDGVDRTIGCFSPALSQGRDIFCRMPIVQLACLNGDAIECGGTGCFL